MNEQTPVGGSSRGGSSGRTVLVLLAVGVLATAGYFAARAWWRGHELRPTTEDALLNAHVIAVQPQVTGTVVKVAVVENQPVKVGDLLFEIDDRPFAAALVQAKSRFAVVEAEVASNAATIAAAAAEVEMAKQSVAAAEAQRTYAQTIFDDTQRLNAAGEATAKELAQQKASLDEAAAALAVAKSALAHDSAQLDADRARLGNPAVEAARIADAQAAVTLAEVNLQYTRVTAPADGHVTQFDLRSGQVVNTGQTLFYLIEAASWWIDANFKETQLARIKPGMPATFTVDMYPDRTFGGTVESISRGSAASFSLLPPENATGNWVKVTQRMTVRIRTTDDQPDAPLRKGASVSVTVDTTAPVSLAKP